jgi:hypothetical protein
LALDIVRLGDPALVAARDLAGPIRSSVPPEVLAEVGLGSLDVPGLPTTWALTSASVHPPDGSLGTAPPGCGGPVLALEYHDLRAMANGWLFLSVWRDTCDPDEQAPAGTGETTEASVDAGRFTGSASQTPGQQYQGEVTDGTIDEAMRCVRRLWDAGLAHRDIKPGNVLVRDGRVLLIDVAFAEVRPTPWRQAVDLANMMLTLALCTSAERVYERARLVFTPAEIGEAFAASRGVTIPSQLRSLLRRRDDDLLARFRELAPATPTVAIQRWSLRRVVLTMAVVTGVALALALVVVNLRLVGLA